MFHRFTLFYQDGNNEEVLTTVATQNRSCIFKYGSSQTFYGMLRNSNMLLYSPGTSSKNGTSLVYLPLMLISFSCSLSFLLCLIVMFISPSLLFLSFFTFILMAFPFSLPFSFPFFAQSFHAFMSSVWKHFWGTPKKICKPQAYGLIKAHYELLGYHLALAVYSKWPASFFL